MGTPLYLGGGDDGTAVAGYAAPVVTIQGEGAGAGGGAAAGVVVGNGKGQYLDNNGKGQYCH